MKSEFGNDDFINKKLDFGVAFPNGRQNKKNDFATFDVAAKYVSS